MTVSISIKPKAPAIPALLPLIESESAPLAIRWAVHCVNSDAEVQALEAIQNALYRCAFSSAVHTKRIAIVTALIRAEKDRNRLFLWCKNDGGLLFAWRGSRALVEPLPASLQQGGAA